MGAAESHLTGPQVLSLKCKLNMQKKTFDIQKLPTVPARLYVVGNQMLQTSTTQHMHSASGLPHVQPILVSAVFKPGTSVCFLKTRKLLQGNLPSDFST